MARKSAKNTSDTVLFRYRGPTTGLILEGGMEKLLCHNVTLDLPVNDAAVQRLIASNHLTQEG